MKSKENGRNEPTLYRKTASVVAITTIALAGVLALVLAINSVQWRYAHDLPTLLYVGWMIDHGAVMYRDIFDVNMPGTYMLMWAVGRITDWSDIGVRIVDLVSTGLLATLTFLWLRPFGKHARWCAAVLFPVHYLGGGIFPFVMQREVLILMPLAATLVLTSGAGRFTPAIRGLFIGLLAGLGALIKPQFTVMFLPAIGQYLWDLRKNGPSFRRQIFLIVAGVVAPLTVTVGYLVATGSIEAFWDMSTGLLPLYNQLNGLHKVIPDGERIPYVIEKTISNLSVVMFPAALLGTILARRIAPGIARVLLLTLLIAAALPILAGKFWDYHYLPFVFFSFCGTALCFAAIDARVPRAASVAALLSAVYVVVALCVPIVRTFPNLEHIRNSQRPLALSGSVASYLKQHALPGDKAQPLDWTNGVVHGMLAARVPLATRFMYDFQLYYFANSDYVQRLRREFMAELRQSKPRWIIASPWQYKAWPGGAANAEHFPELEEFVLHQYTLAAAGKNYFIFEWDPAKAEK